MYEELYGGGAEGTYSSKSGKMKMHALRNDIAKHLGGGEMKADGTYRTEGEFTTISQWLGAHQPFQ